MAMDKETLLAYFGRHYLSRQEVLYKLPFSISIEQFWPELQNRRKAKAVFLPLYNGEGRPYWYVLTEKMIAASERLCEEAMRQEEEFDPYRAIMTSAMTEEMFYTSYVEGAQMQMNEALDFLSAEEEPSDVQEQLLYNNRRAWSMMVGSLYHPIDEAYVKALVFQLTEEMDGQADDYRSIDTHPIAAMQGERYELPTAGQLPERMNEFYDFLRAGDVHPLIKAAVAQAYILVTRPFPEGNERLSRMLSAAVLMRGGYEYFRDISISGVIARENYRYYKAMQAILRSENGGDLTYFLEYFMELLVRAVTFKKERDEKREQQSRNELLRREREMAQKPLRPLQPEHQETVEIKEIAENKENAEALAEKAEVTAAELAQGSEMEPQPNESPPLAEQKPERQAYAAYVKKIVQKFRGDRKTRIQETLLRFYDEGVIRFGADQWSEINRMDRKVAGTDCYELTQLGALRNENSTGRTAVYHVVYPEEFTATKLAEAYTESDMEVTVTQQAFAEQLLLRFHKKPFSMQEIRESVSVGEGAVKYQVRTLVQKNVLRMDRSDWNHCVYTFTEEFLSRQKWPAQAASAPQWSNGYTGGMAAAGVRVTAVSV